MEEYIKKISSYKMQAKVKISPLARKMAELNDIKWDELTGSGIKGKIMKEDILKLLNPVEKVEVKKVSQIKENKKKLQVINMVM